MTTSASAAAKRSGSIRLFQAFGINVYLHWSWLIVALMEFQARNLEYASQFWNAAEYLSLFGIVLMHEFGHALACRSVGGKAERILLWPFGGVAFVNPPRRPGAVLWSIAAGPLVNVALLPILFGAMHVLPALWPEAPRDLRHYVETVHHINLLLLGFNMLPIYPLDGGQILQSLLWYRLGLPRSLTVASGIGLLGAIVVIAVALANRSIWFMALAFLGITQSWGGLMRASQLRKALNRPRHEGLACPACHEAPPSGPLWPCKCKGFDVFEAGGACPRCGISYPKIFCPFCGEFFPPAMWVPEGEVVLELESEHRIQAPAGFDGSGNY